MCDIENEIKEENHFKSQSCHTLCKTKSKINKKKTKTNEIVSFFFNLISVARRKRKKKKCTKIQEKKWICICDLSRFACCKGALPFGNTFDYITNAIIEMQYSIQTLLIGSLDCIQ